MSLDRIAWMLVVLTCAATALVLLLSGYVGYSGVAVAVGISAAFNLR